MNNDTMTDELINALSLYKGHDEGLFSEWCEVLEDDKSLRLHYKYEKIVRKAIVKRATARLKAYGERVKDTQVDFDTWDQEGEQMI